MKWILWPRCVKSCEIQGGIKVENDSNSKDQRKISGILQVKRQEVSILSRCGAVLLGIWFLKFWDNAVVSSSGVIMSQKMKNHPYYFHRSTHSLAFVLTISPFEYRTNMLFRYCGDQILSDPASHPRRVDTSTSISRNPKFGKHFYRSAKLPTSATRR
jgi:hypothetical protein